MHEQLIEESVYSPKKLWQHKVNQKWILLAVGVIFVAVSLIVILIAASSKSTSHDSNPPGSPFPRECGQQTAESMWPWAVEIYKPNHPHWVHTIAQGTLINDRYVLSSAYELGEHKFDHLRILLGEATFIDNVADAYFEGRIYRDVIKLEFMEGPSNTALLRMDRPVTFNGRIQPICLPWVQPQIPQQLLILLEAHSTLISSSVHLVAIEKCELLWHFYEASPLSMCAELSNSKQLCYALRGSPLMGVYRDCEKDRFVQYGIKHFGDCTEGLQIYSNVTHKMKWIQETVNKHYWED